ncbi:2-aminoethanethiol dioxygenase-like [Sarcoptes scabiei]|nr:2-aminoethanethiol dioxygenase-like [Sarcoptes scabiei]
MVVFTCNRCGESLRKNKVEQHLRCCRPSLLTCIDCLKDFSLDQYQSHLECISEEQKYGQKNGDTQKLVNYKGKNKQNEWMKNIKNLIERGTYAKDISVVLNNLIGYDNIPRKRAKFINFVKNSLRIHNVNLIEKVWKIFEESIKISSKNPMSEIQTKQDESKENQIGSNDCKRIESSKASADKPDHAGNDEIKSSDTNQKIQMKSIIFKLLSKHNEIDVEKLQRKVLKKYHQCGYDNIDEWVLERFKKVISKKRAFIIDANMIRLA